MPKLVVQKHTARTHHFDFRLEKEGVFKSWAVPKDVPEEAEIKRLAVQIEGHDPAFGDFEGQIPKGQYGAGELRSWHKGTYAANNWGEKRMECTLNGRRTTVDFTLIPFKHGKPNEWPILRTGRKRDPATYRSVTCHAASL